MVRSTALLLISCFALVAASVQLEEAPLVQEALELDDTCQAENGEACGLELRQLRGELKVATVQEHAPAEAPAEEAAAKSPEQVVDEPRSEEPLADSLVQSKSKGDACMNAVDQAIWTRRGQASFDSSNEKCGRQCGAGAVCTANCLKTDMGYSEACASCMGQLVACTLPKCLKECVGGRSPGCDHCMKEKCRPGFKACSGLDAGGH